MNFKKLLWKKWLWILPILALLGGGPAAAVTASGLYSADFEVARVGPEPTPEQTHDGLAQVLVKLSGRRDVATRPGYGQLMAQAPMLLSQYRYHPAPGGGGRLELSYDATLLERLMGEAGIQGPGTQRPALLLWLVAGGDGPPDYAGVGHPALTVLERQAKLRGLPLQQPLLDLQDQAALPPERLWALPDEVVRKASARYRPDAVLMGRVETDGNAWHSTFRLLADGRGETLSPDGALAAQMTTVVDDAADRLLLGGAPRQTFSYRPRGLVLQVEGVDVQAAYLKLVGLLRRTDGVAAVFPERFSHGTLQLRLTLETSVAGLQETLRLETRLEAVPLAGLAPRDEANLLQYRWRGLEE